MLSTISIKASGKIAHTTIIEQQPALVRYETIPFIKIIMRNQTKYVPSASIYCSLFRCV